MLGLKKTNCIAWTDIPDLEHQDHVIEARFRLDSHGGYAATGIIFRIMHDESYYLALISSKGYFRLDVVKNNAPKTLIGWTEVSDFNCAPGETAVSGEAAQLKQCVQKQRTRASDKKSEKSEGINISMKIITYGTYLIFLVNNKWVGKISDDSITSGRLGFALASYEEIKEEETKVCEQEINTEQETESVAKTEAEAVCTAEAVCGYVCRAYLDYISVDTRFKSIEDSYKKWDDDSNINAEYRLRLADTFAAMNEYSKALEQIEKAWKRRDDAIRNVTAGYSRVRTRRELLLAARLSFSLERYKESEEYVNFIIEQWPDSAEAKSAYTEKMRILTELHKYAELKDFAIKHYSEINNDADYFVMLARSLWELKDFKNSADAWEKAYKLTDKKNDSDVKTARGVYAVNAANANETAKRKKKALAYYITAAKIFFNDDNIPELAALMPKLSLLGENNWEARALIGKWAFSIEDYKKCAKEFETAEKIRLEQKKQPKPDPALYYLWGLVYLFTENKKSAVSMIEKAVSLAPGYKLFSAKLAEIKGPVKTSKPKKRSTSKKKTKQEQDTE